METWVWIVIAVIVLLILIAIAAALGRRKQVESRREEAGNLREQAARREQDVREREAQATQSRAEAQAAEAEAQRQAAEAQAKKAEADRLAVQAERVEESHATAAARRDEDLRRAEELDPDLPNAGDRRDPSTMPPNDPRAMQGDPRAVQQGRHGVAGGASQQHAGDRDGDGRYEVHERVQDKADDLRGRRDVDGDGRRG